MNNACFINTDVPIAQSDETIGVSGSRYLLANSNFRQNPTLVSKHHWKLFVSH